MNNLLIHTFEKQLTDLVNGVPLPSSVKELVVDRVHLKLIQLVNEDIRKEAEALNNIPKGEEDGKED